MSPARPRSARPLHLLFLALVAAAFALPRALALDPGLAGSTAAALIGLGLLAAAALVALVLLVRTARGWRELSAGERGLGLLPLLLLIGVVVALVVARPAA